MPKAFTSIYYSFLGTKQDELNKYD